MDEDEWLEAVVRKHERRSGIRRLYCFEAVGEPGRLELEFVLRGHVFGRVKLWRVEWI